MKATQPLDIEALSTSVSATQWRDAVIYQIYPRSFLDSNGDGIGDIEGLIKGLPYLSSLGVDTLWITPFFASPMHDGGYDVSDYRAVDPMFGKLGDAERFVRDCHDHGLRVVLDLVANHCSDEHPWFQLALASGEDSPERGRFYFFDGRGEGGALPPTDWMSAFGGPAWTRTVNPDGAPGQWYLHLFDSSQPDLNWKNPEVQNEFDEILRFWFDRGVDGFRLDAIPAIGKDEDFRDLGFESHERFQPELWGPTPFWDAHGVHDVLKRWRRVGQEYSPEKFFVGEVVVGSTESLARYIREDELQSVFSIELAKLPWDASEFQSTIVNIINSLPPGDSWLTWTLASHDETRTVTRYAPQVEVDGVIIRDLEVGRQRSRAAYLLVLSLPGAACLYQGEEMGIAQVEHIPDELMQDPIYKRTGDRTLSRDGCRVPLPWTTTGPSMGFSSVDHTWLPIPPEWSALSIESQLGDEGSFVGFISSVLRLRPLVTSRTSPEVSWDMSTPGVVILERGESFRCVVNFSGDPWLIGDNDQVIISSEPLGSNRMVASNSAVWLFR